MPRLLRARSILGLIVLAGSFSWDQVPAKQGDSRAPTSKAPSPGAKGESPAAPQQVLLVRTPEDGIQPQAVEHKGIHLIYFKGDPSGGDVYYVKGAMRGAKVEFSKPLRVNSQRGSVLALGNIRGAQLAISPSGRAHVAWVGSSKAEPKAPGGRTPMLYSRLNDDGTAFEPQRNLAQEAVGVEGGSLSAGSEIAVYWHAVEPGKRGEENRRIWLRESHDDGKTFVAKEKAISPADTGVCGCCGIRVLNETGVDPAVLFRSAGGGVHRDTYLLHRTRRAGAFEAVKLDAWETKMCPMSTFALQAYPKGWLAAWETKGQVYYAPIERSGNLVRRIAAPGKGGNRKHPIVCCNGRSVLFAWTEGMTWGKGGAVAWQVYDRRDEDKDTSLAKVPRLTHGSGRVDGVPPWSLITAVRVSDSQFVIFY